MNLVNLKLEQLIRSNVNPRTELRDIEELAASIKAVGIIEPLVARWQTENVEGGPDLYTIVAGHRRAEAAKIAGLVEVPCVVRENTRDDEQANGLAHLIENTQRDDLLPAEIASAIHTQLSAKKLKQKQLAKTIGKSETWVSKYALIGKAYAHLEKIEEGSGAAMFKYADGEKLYNYSRKVLGLDKEEIQHDLPLEGEESEKEEFSELDIVRELEALASGNSTIAELKAKLAVVPVGKSSFELRLTFRTERAFREGFKAEAAAQ